ncbi:MAG: MFS transporter [Rhodospirillales bacterium]|nr:MFS transporter [Rhodospirillales bacterium]
MSDSPSPQSFAALRHPGYRAYFIGSAMAMMADSIEHVISYWIIFQEFHSPALAGFAVIAHWLPFILFSVHAGALADRFDPRRVMQWGMVLFMGVSVGWGLLFLTDSLEMWHAMVLLALHGIAGVLWAPAGQMLIHDIVGPAQLQSGVRLLATSRTLGFLLGPAIGGGMLLALGPDWGIMVNALIYLPLTIWLVNAPYGPRFRKEGDFVPSAAIRGLGDILATVKNAASNPTIISMTLLAGAASLFVGNAHQAQMPEFSQDFGFGGSGLYYSILLAANGAGAVVAGLVLESKGFLEAKPRTAFILVLLWCLAIAGFAGVSS